MRSARNTIRTPTGEELVGQVDVDSEMFFENWLLFDCVFRCVEGGCDESIYVIYLRIEHKVHVSRFYNLVGIGAHYSTNS